jgi:hypothetical protein
MEIYENYGSLIVQNSSLVLKSPQKAMYSTQIKKSTLCSYKITVQFTWIFFSSVGTNRIKIDQMSVNRVPKENGKISHNKIFLTIVVMGLIVEV